MKRSAAAARRRKAVPAAVQAPRCVGAAVSARIAAVASNKSTETELEQQGHILKQKEDCCAGAAERIDTIFSHSSKTSIKRQALPKAAALKAKRALTLPVSPVGSQGSPAAAVIPDRGSGPHLQEGVVRGVVLSQEPSRGSAVSELGADGSSSLHHTSKQKRTRQRQQSKFDEEVQPLMMSSGRCEADDLEDAVMSDFVDDESSERCCSEADSEVSGFIVAAAAKNRQQRKLALAQCSAALRSVSTIAGLQDDGPAIVTQQREGRQLLEPRKKKGILSKTAGKQVVVMTSAPVGKSSAPVGSSSAPAAGGSSRRRAATHLIAPPRRGGSRGHTLVVLPAAASLSTGQLEEAPEVDLMNVRSAAAAALGLLSATAGQGSRMGRQASSCSASKTAAAPVMGLSAGPRASAGAAGAAAAERRDRVAKNSSKQRRGNSASASVGRMNFVRYQSGGKAKRSFQ
jgi:hypothetical protein